MADSDIIDENIRLKDIPLSAQHSKKDNSKISPIPEKNFSIESGKQTQAEHLHDNI